MMVSEHATPGQQMQVEALGARHQKMLGRQKVHRWLKAQLLVLWRALPSGEWERQSSRGEPGGLAQAGGQSPAARPLPQAQDGARSGGLQRGSWAVLGVGAASQCQGLWAASLHHKFSEACIVGFS